MHVILVYDVNEKRVGKMLKYVRRFLPHIQNSVFEGDLSESKLATLKAGLVERMVPEEDSTILWVSRNANWADRQIIGIEKRPVSTFL